MEEKVNLVCESVNFFSAFDDENFYLWVRKIPCLSDVKGVGNKLFLYVDKDKIAESDLRELLSLFYRYDIDMKQLAIFLNENNKSWFFDNKKAFWHSRVFF